MVETFREQKAAFRYWDVLLIAKELKIEEELKIEKELKIEESSGFFTVRNILLICLAGLVVLLVLLACLKICYEQWLKKKPVGQENKYTYGFYDYELNL